MQASEGHAMLMAKRPWLRKVYYGGLGGITGIVGVGISISSLVEYLREHRGSAFPLIFVGLLLPVIVVGGEVYGYRIGAKKVKCVRCRDCGKEFTLKAIYKTGTCPECNSKKLVGIRFDGSEI